MENNKSNIIWGRNGKDLKKGKSCKTSSTKKI